MQMIPSKIILRNFCSSSPKRIDFYYDCLSAYSWYAFEVLHRYNNIWNIEINHKPILISAIFDKVKNTPPFLNPVKKRQMLADFPRCSRYFNVPLLTVNFAEMYKYNSMSAMRFVTAVQRYFPDHLPEISRQFWYMRFNQDKNFNLKETMTEVGLKGGLKQNEIDMILEKITTQEIKDALKEKTIEAIENGAFGMPTIITCVNGEEKFFFGSDRFPIIAQEIGEKWLGPQPGVDKL